jgi:hypothetical protein
MSQVGVGVASAASVGSVEKRLWLWLCHSSSQIVIARQRYVHAPLARDSMCFLHLQLNMMP